MSVLTTSLTLILNSTNGEVDINHEIDTGTLLSLTNVMISFDSIADSTTAGSIILCV